jgi:hypothetical protein
MKAMTAQGNIIRIRRSTLKLNPDGSPTLPAVVTPRHVFCWTDPAQGDLICTRTAEDLLGFWWPSYLGASEESRRRMRLANAVATRTILAAEIVDKADTDGVDLTSQQREQLLLPTSRLHELAGLTWSSTIPLVLIEGTFAPDTDLAAPISGIDGDVREPGNLIWLRPRTAGGFLRSLARAGRIELSVRDR